MTQLQCINSNQAVELLENGATIVDIRDPQSFAQGRIKGAFNLSNENIHAFLNEADMDKPLLVCCYHGISSQSAGQFLIEQGFDEVYSINNGFEGWRVEQPDHCES
ncbi:thiosulfate sulfurtransferase GlpE [Neptuniibacter caesariensis]|uniref:Thiosulfate sulfurtransferase GlpE n=1 Tax=Neptuniibacter caesariensis TaxID=207954 RepID=A0A7U8GSA6_NEPCE|nr:thiosulfate sulfurtransferase GlpE [Neptuniibacter caesariensis]EAR60880.1 glpE protein [Oceanospirillum sp. MED92] [Neptuniibacter caesariensis]